MVVLKKRVEFGVDPMNVTTFVRTDDQAPTMTVGKRRDRLRHPFTEGAILVPNACIPGKRALQLKGMPLKTINFWV